MPISSSSPDISYAGTGSASVEAQSLHVVMRGALSKSSQNGTKWDERQCLLRSGVFAYFRTRDKLNLFENCITNIGTNAAISNTPKRKIFKTALSRYPPRGFIKLLNRIGRPVSYVLINKKALIFQITHISSQRSFFMKCSDYTEYTQWCEAFTAIGVPVTEEKKSAPMAPRTSRVDIGGADLASIASEFPDDTQSVVTDTTIDDQRRHQTQLSPIAQQSEPSPPQPQSPPAAPLSTPKISVESQSNNVFTASIVKPTEDSNATAVEDSEKDRQRESEERAIDEKIETLHKTEQELEQEAEELKQLLEREKQSTSSFFTSVLH